MTAGVQTLDPSAYVPQPPPSSTSDAKGTAGKAPDPGAAGSPDQPADFQSELQRQDTAAQDPKSGGLPKPADPQKTGAGKPDKKRDTRPDNAVLAAAMPAQIAEPQKPVLPLVLTMPKPDETAGLDQHSKLSGDIKVNGRSKWDGHARLGEIPTQSTQPGELNLSPEAATGAPFPEPRQPADRPQPGKFSQSLQPADLQAADRQGIDVPAAGSQAAGIQAIAVAANPTPDPNAALAALKLPAPPLKVETPKQEPSIDSGDSPSDPGQPRPELKLPSVLPEPAAKSIQEAVNSAPSGPSALAFAARMAADPQKTAQPAAASLAPASSTTGSQAGSPTPAQIPLRYAATAQILPTSAAGIKPDVKKDTSAFLEQAVRSDSGTSVKTNIVPAPRLETASPAAPDATPAAPPQAAATPAHLDRIMNTPAVEPPAAPPSSAHDIRVRVPNENGGSTQVRFVESGGEVRVSVRTADEGLAQNLRTHLNDLTQRLSDGGMPAEIWKPAANLASSANDSHRSYQDGRGSGGHGGQSGQQHRQQPRPAWLEEMEASLHAE